MKKSAIPFLLFILFFTNTFSQDFLSNYDRVGLSVFFITYGNKYEKKIKSAIETASFPEKFDNNMIKPYIIRLPASYENDTIIGSKLFENSDRKYVKRRVQAIKKFFEQNNIGRKIVGKWFNYHEDEGFDLSTIYSRAEYNATDEEIIVAEATKRGEALIRDYGLKLVDNSYIVVIDIRNTERHIDRNLEKVTFQSSELGNYLFKLDFGEDQIKKFYKNWVFEDDPPEKKREKLSKFSNMTFPIRLEKAAPGYTGLKASSINLFGIDQSKRIKDLVEPTFKKYIQKSLYTVSTFSSKFINDFRVKNKISGIRPIKAKVGKKEGLKTDGRYFVYEYTWNEEQKKAIPGRVGVIRVKKAVDNRKKATGNSKASTFYQTWGGKIQPGMVLEEKINYGISIIGNYLPDNGFSLNLMKRSGLMPSLYYRLTWGKSNQDITGRDKNSYPLLNNYKDNKLAFNYVALGVGKGFTFLRNFEIIPGFSFGAEMTKWNDINYNTWAIYPELLLGARIFPNLQIVGQMHYFGYFGKTYIDPVEENNNQEISTGGIWDDEFPRKKANMSVGLRINF